MNRQQLIEYALAWLDKSEPEWGLDTPIDREAFIEDLLDRASYEENDMT